jgi:hypothetical protein
LVAVTRQGREHREAYLLGYVIRRSERLLLATDASPAVPQHQRPDLAEHPIDGISLTSDGSRNKYGEVVVDGAGRLADSRRRYSLSFGKAENGLTQRRDTIPWSCIVY